MGIKERIILFIKSQKISTSEFERRSCLSNGYVNNIRDGMGADKLECVLRAFPMLNRVWLLTGEGEMLNDTLSTSNIANSDRHGTSVAGNGNNVNATSALEKALESLMEQQRITVKAQEQIDRLLVLLENSRN